MKRLVSQIIAAASGLWLAVLFVPDVYVRLYADSNFFGILLTAPWQIYLLLGVILGLLNFFVKPVLNLITLPLRIITLGLFGIIVNGSLIFALDYVFREFSAPLFWPLFWTTSIISLISGLLAKSVLKED